MLFDNTLGAAELGAFFTCILYGITCVQSFIFFNRYPNDGALLKASVWVLWLLDTVHLVFVMHAVYWYTVTNFTRAEVIIEIPWSVAAGILTTPTSDTVVRCWFAWRVWIMSNKKKWLTFPLIVMIFALWAIGIAFAARALTFSTFTQFAVLSWLLYLGLGGLVVVDFYIAATLCFFFRRSRSHINDRTDSIVNVLMVYTINTGLLTSIFSLAVNITYAAFRHNYVFLAMYFPLSKLYINAFLGSLNARDAIKAKSSQVISIPLSSLGVASTRPVFASAGSRTTDAASTQEQLSTEYADTKGSASTA